jgi:hypothetical protein
MAVEAMNVNTIPDIERAIDALRPEELEDLHDWLDQRHPRRIDARLVSDLEAGRMDKAIRRALENAANGDLRPL